MILVTGGSGLVGSHLLYNLVQTEDIVIATKRKNSDINNTKKVFSYYNESYDKLFKKIEWIDCDLLDRDNVISSFKNIDRVYHSAAFISYAPADRATMIRNNIESTENVVHAALENKITKLCYVSSIAALGNSENNNEVDESCTWKPSDLNSGYSISKFNAEMEVWRGIEEGLNAVIVNPSVILGPGKWDTGSASLFNNIWNGFKYYTKGITGFVDVRDVSEIMIKLMNSDICAKRYVLNSENYSYESLFKQIANNLNKSEPKKYATPLLTSLAWRAEAVKCKILNKRPLITKETARSAHNTTHYSNKQVIELLDHDFITIEKSIKDICKIFLTDKN